MSDTAENDSLLVQLTRMEGTLNGVDYKVGDLIKRVDRHEIQIGDLKLTTAQLASDAESRERTVIATARALADAKEAQDSAARNEVTKSEQKWTPASRMITAMLGLAASSDVFYIFYRIVHK